MGTLLLELRYGNKLLELRYWNHIIGTVLLELRCLNCVMRVEVLRCFATLVI